MEKKLKAAIVLKEILEKKPLTSEEFRKEADKAKIKRANFFMQRQNLVKKGEIKSFQNIQTGKILWTITSASDKANLNDVGLCLDEMKNNDQRLRDLGVNEFVHLCQTKIVTHDSRVGLFFKKTFHDDSLRDIHEKVLLAFKYVLVRTLNDGNYELFKGLLEDNKEILMKFATVDPKILDGKVLDVESIRLKKKALYILSYVRDKEVLPILYDLIEKSSVEEYSMLKGEILDLFRSYSCEDRSEIKRELYRIALKNTTKEKDQIIDRVVNLLDGLAESREKI